TNKSHLSSSSSSSSLIHDHFFDHNLWKMVRSAATDEANAMGFLLLMGKFVKQMGLSMIVLSGGN
ncbi:hypothetical protein CISIN_1g0330141mg, partial [Citrus sinensis]